MNVLIDKWLPVVRRSGEREYIAPWEITSSYDSDPVSFIDTGRADLDHGANLFVVSLLQTAFINIDEDDWDEFYDDPPLPSELKERFASLAPHFNLFGDVAFMQDFSSLADEKLEPVERLMAGFPGDSGLEKRTDHFVKRSAFSGVCKRCLPLVLFTGQSCRTAGGAGFQVSVRKNSPILCLVAPLSLEEETLWDLAWVNVVSGDDFQGYVAGKKTADPADIFPWLKPTVSSKKCGDDKKGDMTGIVTPETAASLQVLWCQPGRIRISEETSEDRCSVCGDQTFVYKKMHHTNHGNKYRNWRHPLSPTYLSRNNLIEHITVRNESFTYRDWPVFALPGHAKSDKEQNRASLNVEVFLRERRMSGYGLRVSGISSAQNDLNRVDEAQLKILPVNPEGVSQLKMHALRMTKVAEAVCTELKSRLYRVYKVQKGSDDNRPFPYHKNFFWKETEQDFHNCMHELSVATRPADEIISSWFRALCRKALDSYDMKTVDNMYCGSDSLRTIVEQRRFFSISLSAADKYKTLGITKEERTNNEPEAAVI